MSVAASIRLLRGDARADRAVPPSGLTAQLTVFAAAAMAFLAVFLLCAGLAADRVAARWSAALVRAATIEIPVTDPARAEMQAARVLSVLETTPGIAASRLMTAADVATLLAPWLGADAALDDLPFPLLIAVEEAGDLDREGLILRLRAEVPEAIYATARTWRDPAVRAAGRLRALAWLGLGLVFAVTTVIITLAARAALAINAGIIATLRDLGARDAYIARAFVRRFTLRGLAGAVIGTVLGLMVVLAFPLGAPGTVTAFRPETVQGWALILLIPLLVAGMAFAATRRAAFRTLARVS